MGGINRISRGHSWRGWEPAELRQKVQEGEMTKTELRETLKFIEGGRFEPMLEATHKFYIPLDPDERKEFWRRNPDLMRWVNVWAIANTLNRATTHKPKGVPLVPDRDG